MSDADGTAEKVSDGAARDQRSALPDGVVVIAGPGATPDESAEQAPEEAEGAVLEPAKVMRIGSMCKLLLEEVRAASLDDRGRNRLREIYQLSVKELAGSLSSDLRDELLQLALPLSEDVTPSDAELRIAQAQLVGWLEGLFHGIQATLFAQQMAAQAQIAQMRQHQLGPGGGPDGAPATMGEPRPGTYL